MYPRLAAQIRTQLSTLVDRYDAQLRAVPGYANTPEPARRDWERQVLTVMADCLDSGDDTALIHYIHARAEQLLARGFEPEWLQQAIVLAEELTTPLIETVAEGNFVWHAINRAQAASWQIIANERRRIELTLRESEARYQTIFNSTPIMFWLKDAHNRTLRINQAAAALEGVKPADVEGKSAYDLYPYEQAEAFYQDDLAVINSGHPKLGIIEQHTSVGTGKLMWVETGKTPVVNDQGEIIGVLAFGIDITHRQQAEANLRESEERYRRAITAAGAVPYFIDQATESYRFIGEAIGPLLGYPIEEVTPTLLGQLIQETIMTGQGSALMRETAIQQARTGDLSSWNADYRLSDRLGQTIWLHDSSVQILDESGKPIGAIGILQDITERKQAEEALQRSVEQQQRAARYLRATIEATNELTLATDLDTVCRRAVELAREKFDVERCGLYLIDESGQFLRGTFGTNDQLRTTDEHTARRTISDFEEVLTAPQAKSWVVSDTSHVYIENGIEHTVGAGWVVNTVLRGASGPIGILFNDRALSNESVDTAQQEALAVYCSAVGSIIERKRLEEQVHASLARRVAQVQTSTEVAQEIAAATDPNELFKRVVTLIKERFDYYHAQIFRYDPAQGAVVLVAGYGQVGHTMLAAGHTLPMGRGVVGTAAATGTSILATDVRQAEDWRANPNLPETHGELAVPIKLRDQVLGILDVQSAQANTLSADDQLLLEGLCGQIAIAIESTRLFDSVQQSERDLAKFKLGLERSTAAVFITDPQGVITYVNPAFEKIYGYSSGEAVGQTPRIIKSGVVPREQYQYFWSTLLAKQTVAGEIINKTKDGRLVPIEGSNNPIVNEAGEIVGFLGMHTDITERKRAERELAESAQLLRTLIDAIPDYIYAKDLQGKHILGNQALAQLYGLPSPAEMVGKSDFDLYPPELAEQYFASEQALLRDGQMLISHEEPNVDSTGRQKWNSTTKVPLRDQEGNIIGLVGITSDITHRKEVELELARSAQLLRTIIDNSRDLIYIKDTQGRFLVASQALARLVGVQTADEVVGKSDFDFFPPDLAKKYATDEQNIMLAGEPLVDIEEPGAHPDGSPIWLLTTKIPYRAADGTLLGIVGIGHDITERKQAEQQMEETLRETERLYAAVSAEGWKTYRQSGQLPEGYLYDRVLLQPAENLWEPELQQAIDEEKTIATHSPERAVAVTPLAVRGAVIGALGVYDNPDQPLQPDDLALLETVSEQVALALESARLFEQTQRDAERERTINRITGRIRSARSVEEVLTVATQELRLATQASRSVVDITSHTVKPPSGNGHVD
jgi:PAS domain S-box-containing protein